MTRPALRDTRSTARAEDWRDAAVCREVDPEIFFASPQTAKGAADIRHAKVICFGCPVMQACGQWAMETRQPFGVWGGVSEQERRRILSRRGVRMPDDPGDEPPAPPEPRPAPALPGPAECGTRSGYRLHRKNGEDACPACKRANADADNRLRRTGSTLELAS